MCLLSLTGATGAIGASKSASAYFFPLIHPLYTPTIGGLACGVWRVLCLYSGLVLIPNYLKSTGLQRRASTFYIQSY
ncbi:hypothetical protein F4806DRAFT_473546 [Annulohypoxylon nitens]|nr:hypothetical protein F4806DRAFT_473546 [Annulohypoxylon nitens]